VSSTLFNKENFRKCDEILKKLVENRESVEFRAPVDFVSSRR